MAWRARLSMIGFMEPDSSSTTSTRSAWRPESASPISSTFAVFENDRAEKNHCSPSLPLR